MNFRLLVLVLLFSILISSCDEKDAGQVQKDAEQSLDRKSDVGSSSPRVKKEIEWVYDLSKGLALAKKYDKPVMIDFYADWCGWCRKLDNDTYSDSRVIELSDRFVCVKIDTDRNKQVARTYRVSGLPTIVFLKFNGEVIERISGYRDSVEYIKILSAVIKKS